ncbi:MAG: zinc ribbon domain-containing protein, partial [Muribaculaceae bacterium]|nr:zinc ribbon domain-containing protein [Muribaculaceae bacterium]
MNKQDIKANKDVAKQGPVKYRGAWRPKVAEVRESFEACPHCNAPVGSEMAICPHCGRSLTPGKCSFCGSPMKPNAKFCTRCGQSGEGIVCPECGTLNSRNFCRRCNHPLTPMAMQAMEQAKKDPAFRAVQKKADELAEMQRKILELQRQTATTGQKPPELSDADKALLNEYADILASIGTSPIKPAAAKPSSPREQNEIPERRAFQDPCADLEDIMAAYREKAAELNQALAAMTPPPEYTPEQQRDYFSARK